jgi:hypothetical protein
LVRCVACGEVQWNLRLARNGGGSPGECRVCGAELRPERRRPGRRLKHFVRERRDAPRAVEPKIPSATG